VARSIAEMRLQSGRVRRHETAQEEANEPDLHRNCWPCGADRPDKISGGSKDAISTSRSVGQAGIASACDASLPSSWGHGSCDGVDHPDDRGGPRFGSAEFVTDLPLTKGTDMREHVLLFCLLGLVLTATIILAIAPARVTWALSLID